MVQLFFHIRKYLRMSAFRILRDLSNSFESYSRQVSAELFSAKIGGPFEYAVAKKMRDIKVYTSKLRLLQAKILTGSPQIAENIKNELTTIIEYEEAASWKIMDQQVVKTVTQAAVVKKLLTTPNQDLDPELLERKQEIIKQLTKYRQKEFQLRSLEAILKEKENELLEVQIEWDETITQLKNIQKKPLDDGEEGPLHQRLQSVINKLETMRWLVAKLVTRYDHQYDWATDPHRRLKALAIARQRDDIML